VVLLWTVLAGLRGLAQSGVDAGTAPAVTNTLETPGATATAAPTYPVALPVASPTTAPPAPDATAAPAAVLPTNDAPLSSGQVFIAPPTFGTSGWEVMAALVTLSSIGGFLLYHVGLTRAKNCAHTSMLLLMGVVFGLLGYWVNGFAVQTGGVGDAHAALAQPFSTPVKNALNHEMGFTLLGHHCGFMGNSGFFVGADEATRGGMNALFLGQAVLLTLAVAAAQGAALERGRILAMSVLAFLTGAVIYPLFANWVWGGGWLAELGREFGLGHGVLDLAGAGVVHETAGVLALVIAVVLRPRHGRFTRNKATGVPGHNVPLAILGAFVLMISWTAGNASAYSGTGAPGADATTATAVVNVLLGAMGGTLLAVFLGAWRKQRAGAARLSRAMLGGAVSLCGGSAFFDSWAAVLIGACGGLLVETTVSALERRRIDDPVSVTAIHGTCGAWGLLAVGFFANGSAGRGLNGIDGPVRGLFFGGSWHQLAAQALGTVADFVVVFVLAYAFFQLVQKTLGSRVRVADEIQGLDWPQVGALGYQPDVESEYPDGLPGTRDK
jgi:Amt family ammonium transporter